MSSHKTIRLNALRVRQQASVPIYVFGVEGRLVHLLASVNYAHRAKEGTLLGYQRGAVSKHIAEILAYLQQGDAILPNAIVIAFDSRVVFEALKGLPAAEWGTFGYLTIPVPANASQAK